MFINVIHYLQSERLLVGPCRTYLFIWSVTIFLYKYYVMYCENTEKWYRINSTPLLKKKSWHAWSVWFGRACIVAAFPRVRLAVSMCCGEIEIAAAMCRAIDDFWRACDFWRARSARCVQVLYKKSQLNQGGGLYLGCKRGMMHK